MTLSTSRAKYRKYDTQFKICFLKGTLGKEEISIVPKSTQRHWQKTNIAEYHSVKNDTGIDYAECVESKEEINKLQQQNKCLFTTVEMLNELIKNSGKQKKIFAANKNIIVSTVEKLKEEIGLKKLLKLFSVTYQYYYALKRDANCKSSYLKLCKNKFPSQLTDAEVTVIKQYLTNPKYKLWSRATVYWQILRDDAAHFCKSTFYKYCRLLGFERRPVCSKCKKNSAGIKAAKPAEILHTDITRVTVDNGDKCYISFIQDNYSRYILNGQLNTENSSSFITGTLRDAMQRYNLFHKPLLLITDDGSENKGALTEFLTDKAKMVNRITARIDIPFANNMVEALHKKIKDQLLQEKRFANAVALELYLQKAIETYNNMPHDSLYGLTPLEVWNGALPNPAAFAGKIKNAALTRKKENIKLVCCAAKPT